MVDIAEYFENLKYEIKAVLFDWGNTVMKVFPDQQGPMYEWQHVEPLEGVESLLLGLKDNVKLILTSNAKDSDRMAVHKALERVGLAQYFDHIFTPKELLFRKPDPQYYIKILEILGLEPENVLIIGDDYYNDIIAAKQVGLWTIWLNNNEDHLTEGSYPYHDKEVKNFENVYMIIKNGLMSPF